MKLTILFCSAMTLSSLSFGACQSLSGDPIWDVQCAAVGTDRHACAGVLQCKWTEDEASCQPIAQLSQDPLWIAQCRAAGPTRQICTAMAQCQWVR